MDDRDIPQSLWPVEVSSLHPVAVYTYNWNVVIVTRRETHEEEGYYIIPFMDIAVLSVQHSFLPEDPHWSFSPVTNRVGNLLYAYHRKKA